MQFCTKILFIFNFQFYLLFFYLKFSRKLKTSLLTHQNPVRDNPSPGTTKNVRDTQKASGTQRKTPPPYFTPSATTPGRPHPGRRLSSKFRPIKKGTRVVTAEGKASGTGANAADSTGDTNHEADTGTDHPPGPGTNHTIGRSTNLGTGPGIDRAEEKGGAGGIETTRERPATPTALTKRGHPITGNQPTRDRRETDPYTPLTRRSTPTRTTRAAIASHQGRIVPPKSKGCSSRSASKTTARNKHPKSTNSRTRTTRYQ